MKRKEKRVPTKDTNVDTRKQRLIQTLLTDSNCLSSGKIRYVWQNFVDLLLV